MQTSLFKTRNYIFTITTLIFLLVSCGSQKSGKHTLEFIDFPDLKLGFTTQNFQKTFKNTVGDIGEILRFAHTRGFQFIELRDENALISAENCRMLADSAKKYGIEVIYEIQKNPLDSAFVKVFSRGLENAAQFKPGILRTIVSNPVFDPDPGKAGWTRAELDRLAALADSCAKVAVLRNVKFLIENVNESFFGDGQTYFGLTDLFAGTSFVGLQLDLSNPFVKTSRQISDPAKVAAYLSTMGSRWVVTHLKTIPEIGGEMQPVLVVSPLTVEKVIDLMGKQKIKYVSLELAAVEGKEQCYKNHEASIKFLIDKGVLKQK